MSIPPLLNDFIGLQKDTAIVSVIGVAEAALQAQGYSQTYANFTSYTVAAVFFMLLTIPLARFTDHLIAAARTPRACSGNVSFVDARNVTKRFGDNTVLSGVDLDVGQHQVVCLIGASGLRQVDAPPLPQPARAGRRGVDRGRRAADHERRAST